MTDLSHLQVVEVDDDLDGEEIDSTYGSDVASLTDTLQSNLIKYRFENGRRYNASREGVDYLFPNDEEEQDRLDIIHQMTNLVLDGKLFLAPIDAHPQRILDLGTGTGNWAIDVGDMFPSAEILGNDLSSTQPRLVPPNVKFEIDDMEEQWVYKRPFDLIHARYLATSIQDWPRLVRQAYEHLRPGGWVEFCDYDFKYQSDDGTLTPDLAMTKNDLLIIDASETLGRVCCPGPKLRGWVQEAGFTKVVEKVYKLPLGTWPKDPRMKEIGAWNQLQFLQGVEAWSMALLTQVCGWTRDEVASSAALCRADVQNTKIHAYYNMYVVYGQKPIMENVLWGSGST